MNKSNIFKDSEILCLFFVSTQKYFMLCKSVVILIIFSFLQNWIAPSFNCLILISSIKKLILKRSSKLHSFLNYHN